MGPGQMATADRAVWGPAAWRLIHWTALHEPKRLSPRWFRLLARLLPCAECCAHLTANLAALPPPPLATNADALFAWSVRLHNRVNEQLGKPTVSEAVARSRARRPLTAAEVRPFYAGVASGVSAACATAAHRARLRAFFGALGVRLSDANLKSRRALAGALLGTEKAPQECVSTCAVGPKK